MVLQDWNEFALYVTLLRDYRDRLHAKHGYASPLLFRGHSDDSWKLLTTLERHTDQISCWEEYLALANKVMPEMPAYRRKKWAPTMEFGDFPYQPPPLFNYLIYLRHHGFPSPLMDWTRSPWVAAYFAFSATGSQPRAIYALIDWIGSKRSQGGKPAIHSYGPGMSKLSRHARQQAEYTACVRLDAGLLKIANHEEVFARGSTKQDLLWKFTLPARQRIDVLKHLNSYNINALSLFQSDDRLMETLALREIDFRNHEIP